MITEVKDKIITTPDRVGFTIKIKKEIKDTFQKVAKENNISISQTVEAFLLDIIDYYKARNSKSSKSNLED